MFRQNAGYPDLDLARELGKIAPYLLEYRESSTGRLDRNRMYGWFESEYFKRAKRAPNKLELETAFDIAQERSFNLAYRMRQRDNTTSISGDSTGTPTRRRSGGRPPSVNFWWVVIFRDAKTQEVKSIARPRRLSDDSILAIVKSWRGRPQHPEPWSFDSKADADEYHRELVNKYGTKRVKIIIKDGEVIVGDDGPDDRDNGVIVRIYRKDENGKPHGEQESFDDIDRNIRRHFVYDWPDRNDEMSDIDRHWGNEWYYAWVLFLEFGTNFKQIISKIQELIKKDRENYSSGSGGGGENEYYETLIAIYRWLDKKYVMKTSHGK